MKAPQGGDSELKKRLAERDHNDFVHVLESPEGRRFVWKLIASAGVFHTSHTGNALDTAYREGRRSLGLDLMTQLLRLDGQIFARMQKETASDTLRAAMKRQEKDREAQP